MICSEGQGAKQSITMTEWRCVFLDPSLQDECLKAAQSFQQVGMLYIQISSPSPSALRGVTIRVK